MALSTEVVYAVCYDTHFGNSSYPWVDSGIRLTISRLASLTYGNQLGSVMQPERTMTGENVPSTFNRIPQVANIQLSYAPTPAAGISYGSTLIYSKWVSMVDVTLNSYNPCIVYDSAVPGLHAGAMDDSVHSGVMQDISGTYSLRLPQATLLDDTKTYAVCYAMTDGSLYDSTWQDSYLRLKISKLQSVSSHSVTHVTLGQIANVGTLNLAYQGTIANNMWVSLVDQTLGSSYPCDDATITTASADAAHSGAIQAGASDKTLVFSTLGLSTSLTFAVCFTEGDGSSSAAWLDSAVRVQIAKLTTIEYGLFYPRTFTSENVVAPTSRLPQQANTSLTYAGVLPSGRWLSLVQDSFNTHNPCVDGQVAAAPADNAHSGVMYDSAGDWVHGGL